MQSEWQRKEYLHLTIIQNFDRGKVSPLMFAPPPQIISETSVLLRRQLQEPMAPPPCAEGCN